MRDALEDRLAGCFMTVFPDLKPDQIGNASHAGVAAWDSIAQVTLLSLVGEEFGVEMDFEEFADATSFNDIAELLRAKTGVSQ